MKYGDLTKCFTNNHSATISYLSEGHTNVIVSHEKRHFPFKKGTFLITLKVGGHVPPVPPFLRPCTLPEGTWFLVNRLNHSAKTAPITSIVGCRNRPRCAWKMQLSDLESDALPLRKEVDSIAWRTSWKRCYSVLPSMLSNKKDLQIISIESEIFCFVKTWSGRDSRVEISETSRILTERTVHWSIHRSNPNWDSTVRWT